MSDNNNYVSLTRSEFAESFLYLKGRPFSLEEYPHMRPIYDSPAGSIVMKTSRQVSKSTTLANMMLANAAMIPYHNQLFISPSTAQTQEFSRDKLESVIIQSPFYKNYMVDPKLVQNVYKKEFANGSTINLRYALLNADRIRGISTDRLFADEVQDLREDVLAVVKETMTRSLWKKIVYAGTPKRTKGTLADLWNKSTQYEYAIKSSRSGKWNILGPDNIGQHGLICSKTGLDLDLQTDKGEWVSVYSNPNKKPIHEGYRVCALHFAHSPWVDWQRDIINKMENQSQQLFFNEVLGLEYDSGSTPITREQLVAACDDDVPLNELPDDHSKGRDAIMGIDYGPQNSDNSNTVISILQERGGYLQVVYAKKFLGKEADLSNVHEEIPKLMKRWNCVVLAADNGMGEASNAEFRKRMGDHKVVAFQHLPSQKQTIDWNEKIPAYTLNKTQIIDRFFGSVKKGGIKFPKWTDAYPFLEDLENVILDYNDDKNTRRYDNVGPDDFMHATLFAATAFKIYKNLTYF